MSWQTLCNEKDTEILELRRRLVHAESQLSQSLQCPQHQSTCTSPDTHVRITQHLPYYSVLLGNLVSNIITES